MRCDPQPASDPQQALMVALRNPARFPHPITTVEHLETHISHILLAGDYVYKIKKPLNLGFLDFTSLERRRYYCEEELRLNRRLAPDLYLDCIAICGSAQNPELGGDPARAIEYAVKMLRFPQEALLDRRLAEGALQARHMDALGRELAEFHDRVARADPASPWGSPAGVQRLALDNFTELRAHLAAAADRDRLAALEHWTADEYHCLHATFAARKTEGQIRECHGDLHLGNMILREDRITVFDCIEFSDDLRWIDVMSDLAFLIMDLHQRGAPGLARRVLNGYLEFSGDYAGLAVLRYYLVYRAMVRAKIAAIRLHQPDLDPALRGRLLDECRAYLDLAASFTRPAPRFLLITHGVSGSGKTHITSALLALADAIRIRSDVERKRLFGLGPLAASGSALGEGLYTSAASARTYAHLRELAGRILDAGHAVMVDATFLERAQREAFRALARERGVPFVLLACAADPQALRERVGGRRQRGNDAAEADVAVLERQLQGYVPPLTEEDPIEARSDDIAALHAAILARVRPPPSP